MRRSVALLSLLIATTLVAGGSAASDPALSGQVIARAGGLGCFRASCWRPVPKAPVTILRGERVVRRLSSGPDGRFRVSLDPGVYLVRVPGLVVLAPAPTLPRATLRVVVRPGRTLRVTLVVRARAGGRETPERGLAT